MNKYDVAVVPCKDYDEKTARAALTEALDAVGGLDFVKPGMKIVIKPNLVSAKKPQAAATTHPVLISELIKLLFERGAKSVVVGDSPGGLYNAAWLNTTYNATGMRLCEEAGGVLNTDFSVENGTCNGKVLKDFKYTAYLKEADAIINFAKLKTHGMMVYTGAVKNLFGTIPGTTKPAYHSRFPETQDFANMLIDLYEHFLPSLSIIDAVYGMEGNGPTAGTPRYVGALIASKNGHYADMAGAKIMGLSLEKLPLYVEANKRRLCPSSLDELKVFGNPEDYTLSDYKLIENTQSPFVFFLPKPLAKVAEKMIRTKPKLTKSKCIGCKICHDTCPKDAITMVNEKPVFDYNKCIRCFCCQEFCPKGAIKVHRPWPAKLLLKK